MGFLRMEGKWGELVNDGRVGFVGLEGERGAGGVMPRRSGPGGGHRRDAGNTTKTPRRTGRRLEVC